ncbi:MAG: phosphoribosyl-ATP diphosphatase [Alkalispirochaetaceae bacterium]
MKHPDDGPTRPVIIYQEGHPPRAALMNSKAYNKSREQGELWTLHAETGRLVPADGGGSLRQLRKEAGWYMAELDAPPGGVAGSYGDIEDDSEEEEGEARLDVAGLDAPLPGSAGTAGALGGDLGGVPSGEEILSELQELIDRRREELPEGSYTTHLFTKGLDKIRKKTGEEAVELILAESEEETIYEAADLVYHLMVLLSARGLSIDQVLGELRKRHS